MPSAGERDVSDDAAFYIELGLAVRHLRNERQLSRKELAILSGVSYPYLSEIERGANGYRRGPC